jgi:predicted O-linked N-acetylglucosamine transferase (SPINDLY family)
MGDLAQTPDNPDMTTESLQRALELAIGHHQAGRLAEAEGVYRQILAQVPEHAEALHLLGCVALQTGHLGAAIDLIGRAVTIAPGAAAYHCNLGESYRRAGQPERAISCLSRAIELEPGFLDAHNDFGAALREVGRTDESITAFRRAIELKPDFAEAHSNLGSALTERGAFDDAIAAFRRAIELKPDFAEAHSNLGSALTEKGAAGDAILACRHAIDLKPDLARAHSNLGNALRRSGAIDEAIAAYRRAIELKPDFAKAHCNLGSALTEKGALDDAIAAYRQAIKLKPDDPEAFTGLAGALLLQGDHLQADQAFRQALALRPEHIAAHSGLLLSLQYQAGATLDGLGRAHAEWYERHAPNQGAGRKSTTCDRDPERPLRLGFLSPDLHRHPVGIFLVRALESLDQKLFTSLCYSSGHRFDDLSGRISRAIGAWHDVAGLDDDALAARIHADRVDILFDLSGHTAGHRLLVFESRPAPIQMSWIGYAGTTGMRSMDYLIADRWHVPAGAEAHYRETVLRMPDGYVCYDPPAEAPAVGRLPALKRGQVTFGCFNSVSKLTPAVVALWARIMGSVPGSRLVLVSQGLNGSIARSWIRRAFLSAGGASHQLELYGKKTWPELLDTYNTIDLALDPFPYSGGLTTCEALWMGVPVVTWPGETFAGRHSLSHLSNVGLAETIAANEHEYIEVASRLAGDLPHLAALRAGLRDRMAHSPLCDGERFGRHLMALLRDIWRQHCNQ